MHQSTVHQEAFKQLALSSNIRVRTSMPNPSKLVFFPKGTDLFCRPPLPTLLYGPEAAHLRDAVTGTGGARVRLSLRFSSTIALLGGGGREAGREGREGMQGGREGGRETRGACREAGREAGRHRGRACRGGRETSGGREGGLQHPFSATSTVLPLRAALACCP